MLTTVILFASGVGIGVLGTLIGAGGGWMIVPLLLLGFHFTPQQAVGTSLAVVFFNALSGSVAYMVQGRVLYLMGIVFGLATIPGALLGARLAQYLDANAFSALFGILLLAIAAFLFWGERLMLGVGRKAAADEAALRSVRSPVLRWGALVSFFVGIISSLFGVGGGIIHVPFLILILGIPVHAATATSQFVLAITSLTGSLAFLRQGQIQLATAASMGLGVLIGAQGGAFLSTRMRGEPIRRLLAAALAIFALRLILWFAW
ncbi:MAG: hypothetical protein A3G35_12945 [candidate division NC10 bacterium RIFCSPLOWO2_12_FULL_66_18]|nr:MAG: hypothetical protein A3H39_16265 [candidate division NC10 bacterium RIFCSPLOWO2_02_FULL_66_22]OGB99019.1 MAG: hypothetical protein A3G35_12945 [candidate division NC10 bacterium RIFCSPLOWO2_12_FULL_66_18]